MPSSLTGLLWSLRKALAMEKVHIPLIPQRFREKLAGGGDLSKSFI
jgi:hypothetical protein